MEKDVEASLATPGALSDFIEKIESSKSLNSTDFVADQIVKGFLELARAVKAEVDNIRKDIETINRTEPKQEETK